jgi:hypothetical protein
MKIAMAFVGLLVVVGGACGALYFLKLPPFAANGQKKPVVVAAVTQPAATEPDPETASPSPPTASTAKPAIAVTARPDPSATAAKMARLSSIYEQMPTEDASKVLAKLPDDLVQQILGKMDEGKVAKLMGSFAPDRAARLTRGLAR